MVCGGEHPRPQRTPHAAPKGLLLDASASCCPISADVEIYRFSLTSSIGPPFGEDLCIPLYILLREGCEPALLWHCVEGVYSEISQWS